MIALAAWFAEFLLESTGAVLSFRRRLWWLCSLLGFRALMDVLTFFLHGWAYGVTWWISHAVQSLILCAMACQIAAKLIREHKSIVPYACSIAILGGILCALAFDRGETWANRFLDAQIAASCLLTIVILAGWISRKKPLEVPWRGVAAGLVVSVAGNAACAMAWQRWPWAANLYPVPALIALGLWNWATFGGVRNNVKLIDYSSIPNELLFGTNPERKPVQRVTIPMQSRMVN